MTMVRKQMYVDPEQEAKLKRMAEARGCSEADVLREAVDQISEDEPRWLQRARAAGIIVSVPRRLTDAERLEHNARLERVREMFSGIQTGILEELLRDREDRVL